MFAITSIYAGVLGLFFVGLSYAITITRRKLAVSLGDGGDERLQRQVRAQANCAEYLPLGLILLALAEAQGAPAIALHLLGLGLLAGRLLHAAAFLGAAMSLPLRIAGMVLTFLTIAATAAGLLLHGFF